MGTMFGTRPLLLILASATLHVCWPSPRALLILTLPCYSGLLARPQACLIPTDMFGSPWAMADPGCCRWNRSAYLAWALWEHVPASRPRSHLPCHPLGSLLALPRRAGPLPCLPDKIVWMLKSVVIFGFT